MFNYKIYNLTITNSRGFTLLELLAVLAILAIVLILAIPSGQHLLAKNRTTAQVNTLINELHYARSEAISSNQKLTLCKSANYRTCNGRWRDGQILIDSQKNVLRIFSAIPKQDDLVWNSSRGVNNAIVWLPSGYTNGQRGSFYYCVGNDIKDSRKIVLLDTGRSYATDITIDDYTAHCFK